MMSNTECCYGNDKSIPTSCISGVKRISQISVITRPNVVSDPILAWAESLLS